MLIRVEQCSDKGDRADEEAGIIYGLCMFGFNNGI
jgi:hypothetical protein